jgi:hypothetical protein
MIGIRFHLRHIRPSELSVEKMSFLIQILLPTFDSRGRRFDDGLFARTRAELIEGFGGVTAYLRAPASGAWVAPDGNVERDEVVMVEVVADEVDSAWWRDYLAALRARFGQDEILARALPARRL